MHEYAIAESVLRIVRANADRAGQEAGARVTKVHVTVGRLRQVVPDALAFSFEIAAQGSPAEGAALEIEDAEAAGRCRACGGESRLKAFPLRCGHCGGLDLEVIRGEELRVDWIEMTDADEAAEAVDPA